VGLTFQIVGRSHFRSDLVVDKGLDLVLDALDVRIQIVGERVDKTKRIKPASANRELSYATEVLSTCGERRTFRQGCPSFPAPRS
jgi:hypothetical protein